MVIVYPFIDSLSVVKQNFRALSYHTFELELSRVELVLSVDGGLSFVGLSWLSGSSWLKLISVSVNPF